MAAPSKSFAATSTSTDACLDCSRRRRLEPYPEPTWDNAFAAPGRDRASGVDTRLVLDTVLPIDENIARALAYLER